MVGVQVDDAGIAVALTTAIGVLLTPFTVGGSDAAAGAADAAEVAAIAGPLVEEFETTVVAEVGEAIAEDVAIDLEATAEAVPDIETAEAGVEDVDATIDEELTSSEGETPDAAENLGPSQDVDKVEPGSFHNENMAARHFRDHGADFGAPSVEEYEQSAQSFLREAEEQTIRPVWTVMDGCAYTIRIPTRSGCMTPTVASCVRLPGPRRARLQSEDWARQLPDLPVVRVRVWRDR